MRRDRPPLFMISPASMKKGTAINGKLSAPLMMFCATICESKMSSECISAMPHTISAKAIGMPSAIAPSSETVKTAMVMAGPRSRVLVAFPDGDQRVSGHFAREHAVDVVQQDRGG